MECLCYGSRLLWQMMFSANKGLGLDLEDKTTLLKYPQGMHMRERRNKGETDKFSNYEQSWPDWARH